VRVGEAGLDADEWICQSYLRRHVRTEDYSRRCELYSKRGLLHASICGNILRKPLRDFRRDVRELWWDLGCRGDAGRCDRAASCKLQVHDKITEHTVIGAEERRGEQSGFLLQVAFSARILHFCRC